MISLIGLVPFGSSARYYILSLIGPTIRLISAIVFCRTDSERKAGYTSMTLVYTLLYLGVPKHMCFELFMMQGSAFTMLSGIVMGKIGSAKFLICETNKIFLTPGSEGVFVTVMANISLGALFHNQQQIFDKSGRDLTLLW